MKIVWILVGPLSAITGFVFSTEELANAYIARHSLTSLRPVAFVVDPQ